MLTSAGGSSPVLQQVPGRDLADSPRRDANDDAARSDILRDHGAGRDKGLLADLDPGADHRASADSARSSQQGAAERSADRVPPHRVVVGEGHAGTDEGVVLDDRAGGQITASLNADPGTH